MNSLNQCNFIGNLGKDPETRTMPNGKPVCNFSIACGQTWKDKTTGEKKEKTEWINIVVFDKLAEICQTYLKKGSQVYLSGSMQTRKWQDKDGKDRYTTEIVADKMQMLGGKPATAQGAAPAASVEQPAAKGFDDDDTPF